MPPATLARPSALSGAATHRCSIIVSTAPVGLPGDEPLLFPPTGEPWCPRVSSGRARARSVAEGVSRVSRDALFLRARAMSFATLTACSWALRLSLTLSRGDMGYGEPGVASGGGGGGTGRKRAWLGFPLSCRGKQGGQPFREAGYDGHGSNNSSNGTPCRSGPGARTCPRPGSRLCPLWRRR